MSRSQTTTSDLIQKPFIQRLFSSMRRRGLIFLDKSVPHMLFRWAAFCVLTVLYLIRVYFLQGFYIVTYGLGIYMLNLFIGFLQPRDDPSQNMEDSNLHLPTTSGSKKEYRPFNRRVPEFKFWWSATKSVLVGTFLTFFGCFDVPVFWPILLLYFIVLFTITMKRQIAHMIKYRYLPFNLYGSKPMYAEKKVVTKKSRVIPAMPKVRQQIRGIPTQQISKKKLSKD